MRKYRNRLDIIVDILKAVSKKGLKKTNIMFTAKLSYKLLCRYLTDLIEAEFIVNTKEGSFTIFRITSKGKKFLEVFHDYSIKRARMKEAMKEFKDDEKILMKLLNSQGNE